MFSNYVLDRTRALGYVHLQMERIYHRFELWEECRAGMWRDLSDTEARKYFNKALSMINNTFIFYLYMLRVIKKWKYSCEHNLTSEKSNRIAWIGQAACCMATGSPEHITRRAWGVAMANKRDIANVAARRAIGIWEENYKKENTVLCGKLGEQGVFQWNTR